jgi:hypothetical protein
MEVGIRRSVSEGDILVSRLDREKPPNASSEPRIMVDPHSAGSRYSSKPACSDFTSVRGVLLCASVVSPRAEPVVVCGSGSFRQSRIRERSRKPAAHGSPCLCSLRENESTLNGSPGADLR